MNYCPSILIPTKLCTLKSVFACTIHNLPNVLKRTNCSSVDINTNVAKDVILFKYDNPKFFKLLNLFAVSQFGFWTYLSVFAFQDLKDLPVQNNMDNPWWRRINLGESKYKNTMVISAFIIGYGILSISWIYTVRSVRYLILMKGGKQISLVTYTPFGKNRIMTVDLANVSCKQTRRVGLSQLPLKVKGHFIHYILDMKGEFRNTTLFDYTAGLKRKWN